MSVEIATRLSMLHWAASGALPHNVHLLACAAWMETVVAACQKPPMALET